MLTEAFFWHIFWSKYSLFVFLVENTFCSGDHVSWHSPLDNSESRIQHMLLTEDPQMQPVQTPFGVVTFLQVWHSRGDSSSISQAWDALSSTFYSALISKVLIPPSLSFLS